ncbi:Hypothetical predicted protein [Podarcis lilfordi]|uniref:Uncharacterized protein n=1 Tax=Podarcis lilfordi TaxID=74358 RepID=A0AA35JU06_9SAUR|nr:Hypothetical predicted protein [Podarcis lilfordi]
MLCADDMQTLLFLLCPWICTRRQPRVPKKAFANESQKDSSERSGVKEQELTLAEQSLITSSIEKPVFPSEQPFCILTLRLLLVQGEMKKATMSFPTESIFAFKAACYSLSTLLERKRIGEREREQIHQQAQAILKPSSDDARHSPSFACSL